MLRTQLNLTCRSRRVASFALLALLSGCGPKVGNVTGQVTLDGQPLLGTNGVVATVVFRPASGSGPSGVGAVDAEGRYSLFTGSTAGVQPGDYVVTCTANQLIPGADGGAASGKALSDPKFADSKTSGFAFTVVPGHNEFDVPLESLKGPRPR
jgi:hypothetical protein